MHRGSLRKDRPSGRWRGTQVTRQAAFLLSNLLTPGSCFLSFRSSSCPGSPDSRAQRRRGAGFGTKQRLVRFWLFLLCFVTSGQSLRLPAPVSAPVKWGNGSYVPVNSEE